MEKRIELLKMELFLIQLVKFESLTLKVHCLVVEKLV